MKRLFLISTMVLYAAIFATPGWAQSLTGFIAGTVSDNTGARVPGVSVTLTGTGILRAQEDTSNGSGEFRFPALPPGTYAVGANLQGFTTVERPGVVVSVGGTTRLDFVLEVATLAESVTVAGTAAVVDVDTNRVASSFKTEALKAVPFQRDIYDVMKATPGVINDNSNNVGSSINGAGVRNTGYALDGVNVTDPSLAYVGVRNFNFDTVEEIEIITGAMPAEVGSVAGAMVNVVSKSGGDTFHGGGSYYFANESLQSGLSQNLIDQGLRPGSTGLHLMSETPFDLGGPIRKNKVWFYANYDYAIHDINAIGFRFQQFPLHEESQSLFTKVTLQLNAKQKLALSLNGLKRFQPYSSGASAFTAPSAQAVFTDRGPWGSTQWQWVARRDTYVEARLGVWLKENSQLQQTTVIPTTFDFGTNETSGGPIFRGQYDHRNRVQGNASISHFKDNLVGGNHSFKGGLDYSFLQTISNNRSEFGYTRQFTNGVPTYAVFDNAFPYGFTFQGLIKEVGLYVQDRWRIGERLTLNLGVRYDRPVVSFPANQIPPSGAVPELQTLSPGLYQARDVSAMTLATWNSVSPRLAAAFALTKDQKTVLKASYSKYMEQLFTGLFNWPMNRLVGTSTHRWNDLNGNSLVDSGEVGPSLTNFTPLTATPVDPATQRPYWQEYMVGIERDLGKSLGVAARFVYKRNEDIMDSVDVGVAQGWFPVMVFDAGPDNRRGTADDVGPVTAYDLSPAYLGKNALQTTNPVGATRRYRGIELTANRRLANRWQLFSSLVISRADGNAPNDYQGTSGATSGAGAFGNPNNRVNGFGMLPLDSTYQVKLGGTYELPLKVQMGVLVTSFTGYAYTRTLRVSADANGRALNVGTITVNAEPLGSHRLPGLTQVNINVARTFSVLNGQRLKLMLDVFNLSDTQVASAVSVLSAATFGATTTATPPRYARLGFRYEF